MNAKRIRDIELLRRGVHWVRVNLPGQGNGVNATYAVEHSPTYFLGQLADQPWAVRAILEMAAMK
ncbi:hypothetical protein KAR02_05880 [Candidatus Bipolaricaulota bacterium]|nr:hypothetical protein [Candidatus Bipolaricaulota bacterium]